jgi:hypothetical protein
MDVGINYPWFYNLCGWDFGPDPTGTPRPPRPIWEPTMARNLDLLVDMRVKVVRSFIMANGFSYGTPKIVSKSKVGFRSVATFDPPAKLDPLFTNYFRVYLEKFREKRLHAIPSLLAHYFFDATDGTWGNRYDVANDADKRERFLDTVLVPLLEISKEFKDQIYAWEVMNEPYYNTTNLSPVAYTVPDDRMVDFLRSAIRRIDDAKLPSTVGHRFYGDLDTFPTGRKRQFHYYAKWVGAPGHVDPRKLPTFAESRAFIGEFNGSDDQSWQWPELDGKDDYKTTDARLRTLLRLKLLESKGYELALLWPDGADRAPGAPDPNDTDQLKYSKGAQDAIRDFTHRHY